MKFIEFKKIFEAYSIFSLSDIRAVESGFYRERLNDWQDKGYIRKIINNYYLFTDEKIDEKMLFFIANKIYSPSYISLEMALSYYQIIPESAYMITSIATKKTMRFQTSLGSFSYTHSMPALFFGYILMKAHKHFFKIATPEKALIDYCYYKMWPRGYDDFLSLRIDRDILNDRIEKNQLKSFAKHYNNKAFAQRIDRFLEYSTHA